MTTTIDRSGRIVDGTGLHLVPVGRTARVHRVGDVLGLLDSGRREAADEREGARRLTE